MNLTQLEPPKSDLKRENNGDNTIDGNSVIVVILYLGSAFTFFVRTAAMGGAAVRVLGKGGA
jgi:hypothetical protein